MGKTKLGLENKKLREEIRELRSLNKSLTDRLQYYIILQQKEG